MRNFTTLSEQEVLALAISSEEEDGRTYADFAEGLRAEYPDSAKIFLDMSGNGHLLEATEEEEGGTVDLTQPSE